MSPEPIDPIDECVRLGNLLAKEREWVAALTRDNGILMQAADATKAGALVVSQAGRLEELERENAALREQLREANRLLIAWGPESARAAIEAARKPIGDDAIMRQHLNEGGTPT